VRAQRPLYWHQGLFLQPQHFQQADLYHDFLLQPLNNFVQPYFWGVTEFQLQEAALGNKTFEISAGSFVFPNGVYTVFPGNALIKPRSFDEAWVEADKPFTVYLGLRKMSPTEENVTVVSSLEDSGAVGTRFVTAANPEETADIHGQGPVGQVKRLTYALRVFWETEREQLDNYHLLPVAQLERSGEEIRLSRRFIPPCLTLAASSWLTNTVKDIRDQITSRCRQLEEYKSPKDVSAMELDLGFMVFLLALRSLNRYVPLLYQISETRHVHPWQTYAVLRQLIGELSTFSENLSATGERSDGSRALPMYDHLNLWQCYSSAQALVAELLDGITVGPGHLIRLNFDGAYYTGDLPEMVFDRRNHFWLALRTAQEAREVSEAVRHVAKLCVKKNMTTLISRAVPGIPLEYYAAPPPGLPRRANSHYFRIDQSSALWSEVENGKAISLFWDTAPDDLTAEIIVLRG
jgi:type VI secretion system protein ImpJ